MNYSLQAGGKRIRPLLVLATADYLNLEETSILPYCAAIEMIHTYSLIHDDLPGMDNDDLRRGKPTNHKKFGEGIAILAGDGLLSYSFEYLSRELLLYFTAENILKTINFLAQAIGPYGMVGGQQVDIEKENTKLDFQQLKLLATLKTGKLINAAITGPLLLKGGTDEEIENWENFATDIGILFQLTDDILDVTGEKGKMGKEVNKDLNIGKNTFVSILGLNNAIEYKNKLLTQILSENRGGYFLSELVKFIADRDY